MNFRHPKNNGDSGMPHGEEISEGEMLKNRENIVRVIANADHIVAVARDKKGDIHAVNIGGGNAIDLGRAYVQLDNITTDLGKALLNSLGEDMFSELMSTLRKQGATVVTDRTERVIKKKTKED